MGKNTLLRENLSDQDQVDRFVIDVKDPKDLQITVTNEQNHLKKEHLTRVLRPKL
ncbi:hypothetical protein ACU82A_00240 [Bacillus cereus]